MTLSLDATLGGEFSNSYVDMANAVGIASRIPGGDEWGAADEDVRVMSLIQATRWLETLDYVGNRCAATQRLKWPRQGAECDGVPATCDAIPYKLQECEVMLAIKYVEDPSSFPGAGGGNFLHLAEPLRSAKSSVIWKLNTLSSITTSAAAVTTAINLRS